MYRPDRHAAHHTGAVTGMEFVPLHQLPRLREGIRQRWSRDLMEVAETLRSARKAHQHHQELLRRTDLQSGARKPGDRRLPSPDRGETGMLAVTVLLPAGHRLGHDNINSTGAERHSVVTLDPAGWLGRPSGRMGRHIRDLCWVASANFKGWSVDHTQNNRENGRKCLSQAHAMRFNGITAYRSKYLAYGFFRRNVNNWFPAFSYFLACPWAVGNLSWTLGILNKSSATDQIDRCCWEIAWDKILWFATWDMEMLLLCLIVWLQRIEMVVKPEFPKVVRVARPLLFHGEYIRLILNLAPAY